MAEIVPGYVHLTVKLTHVGTRTDRVLVLQVIRIIIVPQVNITQFICNSQKMFYVLAVYVTILRGFCEFCSCISFLFLPMFNDTL